MSRYKRPAFRDTWGDFSPRGRLAYCEHHATMATQNRDRLWWLRAVRRWRRVIRKRLRPR